jgi:hypothetical protein
MYFQYFNSSQHPSNLTQLPSPCAPSHIRRRNIFRDIDLGRTLLADSLVDEFRKSGSVQGPRAARPCSQHLNMATKFPSSEFTQIKVTAVVFIVGTVEPPIIF